MLSEHGQLLSRDCRVTRELKQATAPVDPPRSASKLAATVASVASAAPASAKDKAVLAVALKAGADASASSYLLLAPYSAKSFVPFPKASILITTILRIVKRSKQVTRHQPK